MYSSVDVCLGTSADCRYTVLCGVATIDALEGSVVEGFDPQFERNEIALVLKFTKIVQHIVCDAIGTCANDQADHILDRECFLITLT